MTKDDEKILLAIRKSHKNYLVGYFDAVKDFIEEAEYEFCDDGKTIFNYAEVIKKIKKIGAELME